MRVLNANSDRRVGVNESSKLYKLDPFLDSDGLLRVGGRLGKSRLPHSEAYSLDLPKQRNISEAIIRWCHESLFHGGTAMTFNSLWQNGFWIFSANVVVRGMIYRGANFQ